MSDDARLDCSDMDAATESLLRARRKKAMSDDLDAASKLLDGVDIRYESAVSFTELEMRIAAALRERERAVWEEAAKKAKERDFQTQGNMDSIFLEWLREQAQEGR